MGETIHLEVEVKARPATVELKLLYPFEHAGEQITSLTLHRLKGKDMRQVSGKDAGEDAFTLLVASSRQAPSVIGELDMEDYTRAGEVIAGFVEAGRDTGG